MGGLTRHLHSAQHHSGPFYGALDPPLLTQESNNSDVICYLANELDQVGFPIAFKSLCVALASLGSVNLYYLQDADYAAYHKLYDFIEHAWDRLHPHQISPAPFPIDIPPTPSSHSSSPFVPTEDIIPNPLPSCDVDQDMIDADTSSSLEDSHKWMPTPCTLEKGKICHYVVGPTQLQMCLIKAHSTDRLSHACG